LRTFLICFLFGAFLLVPGAFILVQGLPSQTCDVRFEILGWPGSWNGTSDLTLANFQDGLVVLTEADVMDAGVTSDQNGSPAVVFQLTPDGQRTFAEYTATHVGKPIAIVYDGILLSTPRIMSPILGGQGLVTGSFTQSEVSEMANTLSARNVCAPAAGS